MRWAEIRQAYPNQWLVIEALEAHSTPDHRRELDRLAVIETCATGTEAMNRYHAWHAQFPQREFYFVHTSREDLEIQERRWLGIRRGHETHPA